MKKDEGPGEGTDKPAQSRTWQSAGWQFTPHDEKETAPFGAHDDAAPQSPSAAPHPNGGPAPTVPVMPTPNGRDAASRFAVGRFRRRCRITLDRRTQ